MSRWAEAPQASGQNELGKTPSRLGVLSILRYRNYRLYWLGQFPSVLGQNMQYVSMAWLVLQLTGSPLALGLVGLAQSAPNIALAFLGGAVADRTDRRRLLIGTQALTALLFAVLGLLVITEWVSIWHVVLVGVLLGVVRSFDQPSRQGLLPMLVPREEIPLAVPLGNLVWQLSRMLGPALAGLLIAFVGIGETYFVAAAGFVIALTLFSLIHLGEPVARPASRGLGHDIWEGIRYIRTDEVCAWLLGMTFFNSVFGLSYQIIMPLIVQDVLHAGSDGFGFLQAASGVGSLAGSVVVAQLASHASPVRQIFIGAGAFGLLLVAFALSPYFGLSLALLFFVGVANQVYMTTVNTTLQMHVPDEMRGRVMGVWGLTWSLMPLGGTISGAIAQVSGPQVALAIGGVLVFAMAVWMAARSRLQLANGRLA